MRLFWIAVTAVVISLAVSSCGGFPEDSGTGVGPVDQGTSSGWPAGAKVTICHIPPGNPANAHTITVGASAVPAHLRQHGDSLGPCPFDGGGGGGGDHDGGGCGGGGGGDDGGDDGGGSDGGAPGECVPIDDPCTTSAACCPGLGCVDGQMSPCADGSGACTCQVVIN